MLCYAKDRNKNIHLKLNIKGSFTLGKKQTENLPNRNFQLCSQKRIFLQSSEKAQSGSFQLKPCVAPELK